jgi:hypothetical protein
MANALLFRRRQLLAWSRVRDRKHRKTHSSPCASLEAKKVETVFPPFFVFLKCSFSPLFRYVLPLRNPRGIRNRHVTSLPFSQTR